MLKSAKALGLAGNAAGKSVLGGLGMLPSAGLSAAAGEPTPKSLGYTMPGEFEPHVGCWMGWPYRSVQTAGTARNYFRGVSGVTVVEMPLEDGWLRDWGPTCVVKDDPKTGKREVAGVHWDYDCYGAPGKKKLGLPAMMPDWKKDHAAGRGVLDWAGLKAFECPMHLEGGSIHSDGQGTLVVTEECLLHPSRNPVLGKEGIEKMLKEYLGLEKIIWLWKGMMGDDQGFRAPSSTIWRVEATTAGMGSAVPAGHILTISDAREAPPPALRPPSSPPMLSGPSSSAGGLATGPRGSRPTSPPSAGGAGSSASDAASSGSGLAYVDEASASEAMSGSSDDVAAASSSSSSSSGGKGEGKGGKGAAKDGSGVVNISIPLGGPGMGSSGMSISISSSGSSGGSRGRFGGLGPSSGARGFGGGSSFRSGGASGGGGSMGRDDSDSDDSDDDDGFDEEDDEMISALNAMGISGTPSLTAIIDVVSVGACAWDMRQGPCLACALGRYAL
ncbi:Agmatine deiminase [Tetrabaena socialis]|uniref:Agmatine deiminase n=1 Tax=Tetrabaena socialis TaxID=47790 RepID=A0A2J7ZM89_9CHLO|nr:Agmatine deiminase [Tetrabaena socialis]|eukprot:PNH01389.1 Agmatine deiminase [Tetrabaena socialis]